MAQIGLERSRIQALIGQGVAAGVPKHVGMYLEAHSGFFGGPCQKLGKARGREGATTL
jgi:hypothetical protein